MPDHTTLTAPSTIKQCCACRRTLPLASFGLDRSRSPLFLQGRCKPCGRLAMQHSRSKARAIPWVFEDDLANIVASLEILAVDAKGALLVPMADRRRKPTAHCEDPSALPRNWLELLGAERQLPQALYALQKAAIYGCVTEVLVSDCSNIKHQWAANPHERWTRETAV